MDGVHRDGGGGERRGVRKEKPVMCRHDLGFISGPLGSNLRFVNGEGKPLIPPGVVSS
jgi:hypothetical protein